MALRAILRRAQAPREPAGKRLRRTDAEPLPALPEPPQETGPIRRYRVTDNGHPYLHTTRLPVPPAPDCEQPAPRAT
eukprot:16441346-Heterocapsa_arctica.AAC.1